jgi:2,4-dienoyl-CoA reductase-like NADH-dependent reductase (Old Yellow Enzyme family)/alpha-beta hydrolase superfamily lysophospholipase
MSEHLFTPASIGGVTIPNRLVRSATIDCMCPEPGVLSESYLALYERLARGGAGLIVTGNYFVHRLGVAQPNILVVDADAVIPELERLIAVVKRHGALIFGQLNHGGRYCKPSYIGGEQPMAPSPARDMINKTVPRPMTEQDIETAIDAYASAAQRLERAGFDGVEINASHGYLVNQFLSARTNWRRDAWGGSLENRFRFLEEIVRRIRGRTRFPVTAKISGQDYVPRGVTLRESVLLAGRLESLGVSGLTVSGGLKESPFTTMDKGDVPRRLILRDRKGFERVRGRIFVMMQKRGARFSEAYFLDDAAAIRAAVSIPVTAVGGFRSVEVMEKALRDARVDFIGMSRPFIREPDLPRRLREGGAAKATCVNCNLCLIKTVLRYDPVACYWKKGVSRKEKDGVPVIVEDRLRASDGFRLFYRGIFPATSRAAVVFLHGMSEHSGMYPHVIQAFGAAGFAVLAPDQRGRGQSVAGRWHRGDLHSMARVLRDLDELRERHRAELDGRPVFLVAVSMGAIIGQLYALQRQGSLSGVVLVGPPYGVPSAASPALLAVSSILAALAPRLPVRPAPLVSDISRERGVQWELECDPYCYHGPLRARAGRQFVKSLRLLENRLGEIALPLLIQYGTGDTIVSKREVQEIRDRWGGTDRTVTVMNGLYHDVLNEPERYQAIDGIISWMDARVKK